jgi:hypothetical protein
VVSGGSPVSLLRLMLDMRQVRYAAIIGLLFLGGLTADFTPLSLFLSLQASDVLLIAAGLLALPTPVRVIPAAGVTFLRANRLYLTLALLGGSFLVATGISTAIAVARPPETGSRAEEASVARNRIPNGGFERGLGGWGANAATISRIGGRAGSGAYQLRIDPVGRSAGEGVFSAPLSIEDGGLYRLSTLVRASARVVLHVRIDWYRGARHISSSMKRVVPARRFESTAVASTAPERATRAQPVFYTSVPTSNAFYVDRVEFVRERPQAAASLEGVETWLLFAMLFGCLVPLTAVAVARHERGMLALALGLACGAVAGSTGYLGKVLESGESFFHGPRRAGVFGSDPFFLFIVGLAIVLGHLTVTTVRWDSLGQRRRRWARPTLIFIDMIGAAVLIAALFVAGYRAGWVATIALTLLVIVVAARTAKALALTLAVAVVTCSTAYALGAVPNPLIERVQHTFDLSQPDFAARRDAIAELLEAWFDRPWGIGLGESDKYLSADLVEGRNPSAHNFIIHAFIEGGPLAGLAMAAFPFALVFLWKRHAPPLNRREWHDVWPIAAVVAVVVAAYFSPTLYQHAAWTAVGALIGWAVAKERGSKLSGHGDAST